MGHGYDDPADGCSRLLPCRPAALGDRRRLCRRGCRARGGVDPARRFRRVRFPFGLQGDPYAVLRAVAEPDVVPVGVQQPRPDGRAHHDGARPQRGGRRAGDLRGRPPARRTHHDPREPHDQHARDHRGRPRPRPNRRAGRWVRRRPGGGPVGEGLRRARRHAPGRPGARRRPPGADRLDRSPTHWRPAESRRAARASSSR